MNKKALLLLALFSLFLLPLAIAKSYLGSTTWTMNDITTNSTNCTSVTQIGYGYSKSLGTLTYTNSTVDWNPPTQKNLSVLLRYGDTSGVTTNTTWRIATSIDATSLTAKYVGVCFKFEAINGTGAYNTDSIQLTYAPDGAIDADTLEGLPWVGSDTGSFLKNLAPGIGAFIIIMGVFAAIGGIIYAIVGVVKNKVTV